MMELLSRHSKGSKLPLSEVEFWFLFLQGLQDGSIKQGSRAVSLVAHVVAAAAAMT